MSRNSIDRPFLSITLLLVLAGFFIFISASLGLLARDEGLFSAIALNQIISLGIGLVFLYITSKISYKFWNTYAFYIFVAALALTLFVFIPGLGFEHAGARRWLSIGAFSFQPAELLKLGFVIYLAAWLAGIKQKVQTLRWGVIPFVMVLALSGSVLALQPDFGTFIVIIITGFVMYFTAGGKWSHIITLGLSGIVLLLTLGFFVPYIQARLLTFANPAADPLGAGYQIQQSLIAIGSGGVFGRGFGQSVQKFNFLPEPIGDSIFAVFAEEWGFLGAALLIIGFLAFLAQGLRISVHAPTIFSRLTVIGLTTMIVSQSFINIAAMMGIFPLTGMPLLFVSQGGSALMIVLAEVGIILSISKFQKKHSM